ncbi:MAG TPA: hypothetical protein VMV31_03340 [Terriglobales bacterium]|nr:hypothetical protein [Terriglobales bacterium]
MEAHLDAGDGGVDGFVVAHGKREIRQVFDFAQQRVAFERTGGKKIEVQGAAMAERQRQPGAAGQVERIKRAEVAQLGQRRRNLAGDDLTMPSGFGVAWFHIV